ncbi:MAG TPA: hypothetical protein VFN75_00380, partial [Pseudonocardiaceae bacterium]|nr:hypothetical protein [Pseudonocardiaceae bacterium]
IPTGNSASDRMQPHQTWPQPPPKHTPDLCWSHQNNCPHTPPPIVLHDPHGPWAAALRLR